MKTNRSCRYVLTAILMVSLPATGADLDIRVIQAFIVGDGTVAGAKTDFVVDFAQSPDPSVAGLGLAAGGTVTLVLAPEFTFVDQDFLRPIIDPPCVPYPATIAQMIEPPLQCNTLAFPQGWPQAPVPPGLFDSISYDASRNAVTATVGAADIEPFTGPVGPGVKTLHAILNGFTNPAKPGMYPVAVEIDIDGDGSVDHSGTTPVHILPRARRAIGIMSFCNDNNPMPPNRNSIYQNAATNTPTEFPYDLVLWSKDATALNGVNVWQVNDTHAILRQGNRSVGHIRIDAPDGADGMVVWNDAPSGSQLCGPFVDRAPLSGEPAAFLRVNFKTGSAAGLYTLHFSINGGNEFRTFVQAD